MKDRVCRIRSLAAWLTAAVCLLAFSFAGAEGLPAAVAAVEAAETALPDGEYAPESFSFAGGTGRLTIECERVTVSGGRAAVTLRFSSGKIAYVKLGERQYAPESVEGGCVFTIPARLNVPNTLLACTTAMSRPHEIEYSFTVTLAEPDAAEANVSAELFTLRRQGGCLIITTAGSAPLVFTAPAQRAYVGSVGARELIGLLPDAGDRILDMPDGPDWRQLLLQGCDLAILPGDAGEEIDTFTELGIPVLVDRSCEEKDEAGFAEWLRVYAAVFGCEEAPSGAAD